MISNYFWRLGLCVLVLVTFTGSSWPGAFVPGARIHPPAKKSSHRKQLPTSGELCCAFAPFIGLWLDNSWKRLADTQDGAVRFGIVSLVFL